MRPLSMQYSVTVGAPLEQVLAWCQSRESRRSWPGVTWVAKQGPGTLTYEVDMRTKGAKDATIMVEEHLRHAEEDENGYPYFETAQRWSWPTQDASTGWTTYRFVPVDGQTRIDYTMRLVLPGSVAGERLNLSLFGRAIERAAELYVERLGEHFSTAGVSTG
ncbi:MAG: SRPBCC family protein [Actinomycetota bacterium]